MADSNERLAERESVVTVDGAVAVREAAIELIGGFQSSLAIVSDRLNPNLYNDADLVDCLREQLLDRHRATVRILIHQPRLAVTNSPRLIALARRMSSQIELRVPDKDPNETTASLLIADRYALLYRPSAERWEATLTQKSPVRVKDRLDHFEAQWIAAIPSPELRDFRV